MSNERFIYPLPEWIHKKSKIATGSMHPCYGATILVPADEMKPWEDEIGVVWNRKDDRQTESLCVLVASTPRMYNLLKEIAEATSEDFEVIKEQAAYLVDKINGQ